MKPQIQYILFKALILDHSVKLLLFKIIEIHEEHTLLIEKNIKYFLTKFSKDIVCSIWFYPVFNFIRRDCVFSKAE